MCRTKFRGPTCAFLILCTPAMAQVIFLDDSLLSNGVSGPVFRSGVGIG